MTLLSKLKHLLPGWRRSMEQDMRDELESIAALAKADGCRPELGNLTRAGEDGRSVWIWRWVDQLSADIIYAARMMRTNPGFTATALLSLALGIGANTAIFSLINAILLKSLPVKDPHTLVVLTSRSRNKKIGDFGYPDYLALRNGSGRVLSGLLAASSLETVTAGINGETEPVERKIVSGDYFSVLGVQAAVGRTLLSADESQAVAVISDRCWKRSFGGSDSIIGKQIDLEGMTFTIVGVAPPEFSSETAGEQADVWTTVTMMPASQRNAPGFTWLNLMGRLRAGVDMRQASERLTLLAPSLLNRFIDRVEVEPGNLGGPGLRDSFRAPLTALMAVVAVTLLIACTNLASLLLARAANRQKEIATRLAIGASRGRVFRQLITESIFLAIMGGLLGLLFATWGEQALLNLVAGAGRAISMDLRPDTSVLVFTASISIVTGLLFGFAPALHAIRENTGEGLKLTGSRPSRPRRQTGVPDALLAFQVALSLALLVIGGLFIRTLRHLRNQDLGVQRANVLTLGVEVERAHKPAWPPLITELLRRTAAIPGVTSSSASFNGMLGNRSGINGFQFEGRPPAQEVQHAEANWVAPTYFATLGIPVLHGREFLPSDNIHSQRVVILNQTIARNNFGNEQAVGRRLLFNGESYEIIGVARDAKYSDLRASTPPFVYFAALQSDSGVHEIQIRTAASPIAAVSAIRAAVREADPRLKIMGAATLEQRIDQKLAREVLVADLSGFFAGLTLVLVVVGVYGTLAYTVARRTKEIGIRMALGASFARVAGTVMQRLLIAGAVGLVFGVAAASAAAKMARGLLFGLTANDPSTIAAAVAILTVATLAAGCIPVLRSSRVDPATVLRLE